MSFEFKEINPRNSDEVEDIITSIPSWIVRWGIAIIFLIFLNIIFLSALIKYPESVKTKLKVNSKNSPKAVKAPQSGKIEKIKVQEGETVKRSQILAIFETTASIDDVNKLYKMLRQLQNNKKSTDKDINNGVTENLNLGELQSAFQTFYQDYLKYLSTQDKGFYTNQIAYIEKDLNSLDKLRSQILKQQEIQAFESKNHEADYKAYKTLYAKKVISKSEFIQQENKYYASRYPLQQTQTALLNNYQNRNEKEKELSTIKYSIMEQRAKFVQSVNQCLAQFEAWMQQYTLRSPISGKVSFAGIIQQDQYIMNQQEIFIINPGNTDYFGEVLIPQYNMGKIKLNQNVLVKLKSFPFEEYGIITGKLAYIADVAQNDSVFVAKVIFNKLKNNKNRKIVLKNGMLADAEIITEESSLLKRFFNSIIKVFNNF